MRVSAELEATLVSAAIGAYPQEAVCLLGGKSGQITSLYAVHNAADNPFAAYFVDPAEQLEAEAEMRRRGEDLLAIFHSHPKGPAIPSTVDTAIARKRPDVVHIIVSVDHEELRGWHLEPSEPGNIARWHELDDVRCSCGSTEPDYFGVRDQIESADCPLHAAASTARDPFNDPA